MKTALHTEAAIANLVAAYSHDHPTAREEHIYREALRSLVRLAVMEHGLGQKAEMENTIRAAVSCGEVRRELHAFTALTDLDLSMA